MEGKGLLFKIYAGIDVFDIEVNEKDPEKFIQAVKAIAPTFGGINLEDIKAPECFEIENRLKEDTPVAFLTKLLLSHLYGALITWCMLGGSFKLSEESNQFVTEEVNAFLYKYMK